MTQANVRILARCRSSWSLAASWTGVASGSVTKRIRVNSGSRKRGNSSRTLSGNLVRLPRQLAVVGQGCIEQQDRVSRRCRVQDDESVLAAVNGLGEGAEDGDLFGARRTQVLFQQVAPWASRPAPVWASTSARYASVSTLGSIRLTLSPGGVAPTVFSTCAAGSVVVRWTRCPRRANSTATAAAIVVFPTPPFPIVRITPRPDGSISSRICVKAGGNVSS